MTNQKPYQELQAVIRAKEAVERENAEIKRRLAAIIGDLQPLIGSIPAPEYASPVRTYSRPAYNPAVTHSHSAQASTPGSVASPGSTTDQGSTAGWGAQTPGSAGDSARTQLDQQRHELRHGLDMGPERLGLGFLLDPHQRVEKIQNRYNGPQDSPRYQHVPMKHDWTNVRHDQALRKASWGSSPAPWLAEAPPTPRDAASSNERTVPVAATTTPGSCVGLSSEQAPWSIPIKNGPPTCPLDSLLLDFLFERRQRAAEGLPSQEVVGPRYPSVSSLLNPSTAAFSHPLSKVFTDILSTFPDISTLPERVAVLYIMFLIMRWQISPTRENFERLPPWVRPVPSQLRSEHPAWIDHLPFPRMRDRLVRGWETEGEGDGDEDEAGQGQGQGSGEGGGPRAAHGPGQYPFDNFFIPFTTTLSLSWPYEDTDTLLQSPDSDELMINPVFERHLRNLDNWKLGDAFAKAFPTLVGSFNLSSQSPARPSSSGSR